MLQETEYPATSCDAKPLGGSHFIIISSPASAGRGARITRNPEGPGVVSGSSTGNKGSGSAVVKFVSIISNFASKYSTAVIA